MAVRSLITSAGAGSAWAELIAGKVRVDGVSVAAVGNEAISGDPSTSSTTVACAVVYFSASNGVNDAERVYLPGASTWPAEGV